MSTQKIESTQYNVVLTTTDLIKDSSAKTLYQELRLESMEMRRWWRKLCLFDKIINK